MKKISLWVLILFLTAPLVRAQDTATQQQIDKLTGSIQDIQETLLRQNQRLDVIEKEISDLREKVNAPVTQKDFAERDDLRKLAEQVQEIDRKRQDDRELILKQIEAIGKAAAMAPLPTTTHSKPAKPAAATPDDTATPATPVNGYEYLVKQGDTLGLIAKAYREKGVKVTKAQIIAANPKMNPEVLIPGKKIFIPDASAK